MLFERDEKLMSALQVARMYYYQDLNTEEIANELGISRSKVSRLLRHAKDQGLIEIRIRDPDQYATNLEDKIQRRYNIKAMVISVSANTDEHEWLDRVANYAASYLDDIMESEMMLAVAWGTTISLVTKYLVPKQLFNVDVVQLNGSGNTHNINNSYAGEIITQIASNYSARPHLFPVPTFFDYAETKQALWRERSVRRILELQQQADVLLYSIGATDSNIPSQVYQGGYLEEKDMAELEKQGVVGDIATVFFRANGSYKDIPLNARASGPDLELFQQAPHAICVVSGRRKVHGLRAALRGGYLQELIVDEPTARLLLELEGDA